MAKPAESKLANVDLSTLALGLAIVTATGALAVGLVAGVASAMLVLVTGALLGSILLVWHSLRTLAGDAEVEPGYDAAVSRGPASPLAERKRRALRALKDIEQEHSVGKIDDADFKALDAEYRERAKDVIREMDEALEPWREKAETLVRAHLEKRAAERAAEKKELEQDDGDAAITCPSCKTSNDGDATFCKKCGTKLSSDA